MIIIIGLGTIITLLIVVSLLLISLLKGLANIMDQQREITKLQGSWMEHLVDVICNNDSIRDQPFPEVEQEQYLEETMSDDLDNERV